MALSKRQFLELIEHEYGYRTNEWQSIHGAPPPNGTSIFTIGEDEEGFFHHINNEFFDGDEEILISMGVTDWQFIQTL